VHQLLKQFIKQIQVCVCVLWNTYAMLLYTWLIWFTENEI